MLIKICGVRGFDELNTVERYADYTGVVVDERSRRHVGLGKAREIIESASIPVFVVSTTDSIEEWEEIICKSECRLVQVHNPDFDVKDIRENFDVGVMQAFLIRGGAVADRIVERILRSKANAILLDSGCGSGRTHDWRISGKIIRILREKGFEKPVFLAGGLKAGNVKKAVETVRPDGVDVSSGVEVNGVKNERLIEEFCKECKLLTG